MSEEIEIEQNRLAEKEAVIPPAEKKIGLFTRQPFTFLGKVVIWSSIPVTLAGIGGIIALIIGNGSPSRDLLTLTILTLISGMLLASRIRWLQGLSVLIDVVILYQVFTEPFALESLANPKGPNGGYAHFVGDVFVDVFYILMTVAAAGQVLQNYQKMGRKNPDWWAPFFSAVVGLFLGSLFIGALAPAPSPALAPLAPLQAPQLSAGPGVPTSINMGMPAAPLSVSQLQQSATTAHVDQFTLTAQSSHLNLSSGLQLPTWTFNGTAPGPTLHVRQGDEVVVTLINHLSFGVTIHWHGVRVPNSADGVAGVTQDAVKPGQSYVYRFTALDSGTYWYHSHQFSDVETSNGLFGMLIVDPVTPLLHTDVDESVALHTWSGVNNQSVYTMNTTDGIIKQSARPGQWVRLRVVNTAETSSGNPQLVTLVGAPFRVVALDGHDLNGGDWLTQTPLPLGAAQRYDLYFQMPAQGPVSLVTTNDGQRYATAPALLIGQGKLSAKLPPITSWFDIASYGTPGPDTITTQSHFAATYGIVLGNQIGTSMGRSGMTYTLNGKVFPDTAMIMVKEGQIIKLHFDNQTNLYHPMHLHGHIFTVLSQNGKPLTGSPIHLDTVLVPPHSTYDVAFLANNPGIWMLHCHNFLHANWGMDMMVMYNVSTPYTVGSLSGNFPD